MSDLENATTAFVAREQYDVAILGGGLAGLTLALQIKKERPESSILVIEKQKHPVPEAAYKVGESTLEIAARYLLDLGLEEHLHTRQLKKFGLRFFFSTEDNQDITRRLEIGLAQPTFLPSYQLDRGRFENMLGQLVQERGVTFLDGCKIEQISLQPELHTIHVRHENSESDILARWIVDTSGRSSLLKRKFGLAKEVGHHVNAVWFRINRRIAIDDWSDDPTWQARVVDGQRYLGTIHLCGKGYWVWLIPLASGSTSVGIVSDPRFHPFDSLNRLERALDWLRAHEPQCARSIENEQGGLDDIQDFRVMKDYSYSCRQVYSSDRWCLTGEAGVFLDPLYSPGSDFIAMGNELVTDLVTRYLDGEDIRERARSHNLTFLSLANVSLKVYEQQYSLMGHAQIMVAKYLWDVSTYWGNFSQLYFHHKMRSMSEDRHLVIKLYRSSKFDTRIQEFFREWARIDRAPIVKDVHVDHYNPLDFVKRFHITLRSNYTRAEFDEMFDENLHLIERIAGLLVSRVIEAYSAFTDDAAIVAQVECWKADPLLAECVELYKQEAETAPINDYWVLPGWKSQYEVELAH